MTKNEREAAEFLEMIEAVEYMEAMDPASPNRWRIAIRDTATGEVFSAPSGVHAYLFDRIPKGHQFVCGYIAPSGHFFSRDRAAELRGKK
jgi:hypothetical protein